MKTYKAMVNAIKAIFPQACHRVCLWHIVRNVMRNRCDKFKYDFIKCVNKYRTPNNFEKGWKELVLSIGSKIKSGL